jgi:hypothetical protein
MREFFLRRVNLKNKSNLIFLLFFISYSTIATNLLAQDTIPVDSGKSTPDALIDTNKVAAVDSGLMEKPEDHSVVSNGHSHDEIKRGERIFMGLLPFERKYESCVSCHNLNQSDTLNWNPSALDIALKFADKDFASFQQVVMQPSGKKMEASHVGFNIDDENLRQVKVYLDNLAQTGTKPIKPSFNNLILFIFLGLLLTWALLELIFFRKLKWKFIPVIILLGAFGYQLFMIYDEASKLGRSEGYQPDQPIKFSHQVHVTENHIDCMYCHHTADNSKTANIPSTNLCMNCHIVVREGTRSGKFEISKLLQAHEEGRSVEWIRIHKLPDHVFFSHAQHVGAGNLDCIQCHGKVEEMHVVRQEKDLSMGWCLDCHRQTKVDFIDNDYYSIYKSFHEDLKKGLRDSIVAADIGANDCAKCHY